MYYVSRRIFVSIMVIDLYECCYAAVLALIFLLYGLGG